MSKNIILIKSNNKKNWIEFNNLVVCKKNIKLIYSKQKKGKKMKYIDVLQKLQKENPEHIILMKNGIFFVAIGKDAIELNKQIGLQLTCMKKELCKVGFQAKSLEKYIEKIKDTKKSFIIYIYNKETQEEEKIYQYTNEPVIETKQCNDCTKCNRRAETEDEIIERVKKLGTTS